MNPPIFEVCSADLTVQSRLGDPARLYPFGEAEPNPVKPYAVWQIVGGSPENYLDCAPDIDAMAVQIDCYATSAALARAVAQSLRDAIEPVAHITRWSGEDRDRDTNLYRYSFDVDWLVPR